MIDTLFKGMDQFVTSKTVVGEPVQAGDAIIVPLIDVTCGMAAGAFSEKTKEKQKGGGGMSAKMSPKRRSGDTKRSHKGGKHQKPGCHHKGDRYGSRPD